MGLLCCYEDLQTGRRDVCPAETHDNVTLAAGDGWETWQTHVGLAHGECLCPLHLKGAARSGESPCPASVNGKPCKNNGQAVFGGRCYFHRNEAAGTTCTRPDQCEDPRTCERDEVCVRADAGGKAVRS